MRAFTGSLQPRAHDFHDFHIVFRGFEKFARKAQYGQVSHVSGRNGLAKVRLGLEALKQTLTPNSIQEMQKKSAVIVCDVRACTVRPGTSFLLDSNGC